MTKTVPKKKETILIAIDNDYIKWIRREGFVEEDEFTLEEITEYINSVLENHKRSWQELE